MAKPLVSEIVDKAYKCNLYKLGDEVMGTLKFFEWAYNEGKKSRDEPQDENCTCSGFCKGNSTHKRKPTKMELATT